MNNELSLLSGAGTGQRPGSLTELYSLSPYSAQLQRSLHFFRGNPGLAPEQLLQADTGRPTSSGSVPVRPGTFPGFTTTSRINPNTRSSSPPEVYNLTPTDASRAWYDS